MKAQSVSFVGLLVAGLVAGGWALYLVGRLLPVPGGKFLVMAPYLALIMFVAIDRLQMRWTMSLLSAIFAAVLSVFTPIMSVAILAAGLLSDMTGHLIPGKVHRIFRTCLVAALYPMWSFLLSLLASNYLTGNVLFGRVGTGPLLVGVGLSYLLGLAGTVVGLRLKSRMDH